MNKTTWPVSAAFESEAEADPDTEICPALVPCSLGTIKHIIQPTHLDNTMQLSQICKSYGIIGPFTMTLLDILLSALM